MLRHMIRFTAAVALAAGFLLSASLASAQSTQTFEQVAADDNLTARHADALRLYWAFFDRQPEASGASYWVDRVDACATLLGITWSFANSTEFINTYGDLSNDGFIDLIYANVLDRQPDATGRAYWSDRLEDGRLSRPKVMLYFSLSNEFRAKHPLPSDGVADRPCGANSGDVTDDTTPPSDGCHPAYKPCLPITTDLNCSEISDPVTVLDVDVDPYKLDRDNDGVACES